jgi:hypothetical protein
MKKLLLLSALLIFACSYGQGEQLYADGTATDQNGNSFEWISYSSQDWAIENAEVVTYRKWFLFKFFYSASLFK